MIYIIIGFIAGVLSGLFGIGGGVVIVPALIMFTDLTQKTANGISIASLLLPVGILGVIKYRKEGFIRIKISLLIGIGLLLGTYFGALCAINISSDYLKILYALFLFFVAYRFIKNKEDNIHDINKNKQYNFLLYILLGICAGILSGMFGIGGGVIIVPILISFFKFDTKTAAGTSLGALLLPVGLFGVIKYYSSGYIEVIPAVEIALSLAVGVFFGAALAMKLSNEKLKKLYGVFLIITAIKFIF